MEGAGLAKDASLRSSQSYYNYYQQVVAMKSGSNFYNSRGDYSSSVNTVMTTATKKKKDTPFSFGKQASTANHDISSRVIKQ